MAAGAPGADDRPAAPSAANPTDMAKPRPRAPSAEASKRAEGLTNPEPDTRPLEGSFALLEAPEVH